MAGPAVSRDPKRLSMVSPPLSCNLALLAPKKIIILIMSMSHPPTIVWMSVRTWENWASAACHESNTSVVHSSNSKCYTTVEMSHRAWSATRSSRLPSSFGVAVHVVAGRTCSPGIVRPLEDPDSLVPRQGPWHELQLSWSWHAARKSARS